MAIIIFDRTLIFWSGIFAGFFSLIYFLSCHISPVKCSGKTKEFKCKIHSYSMWPTYFFILVHIVLALLASFGVYF